MSPSARLHEALRRTGITVATSTTVDTGTGVTVDADTLALRVAALDRFAQAASPHVPTELVYQARALAERAGLRLALSRGHTVVALAGTTGSGKSSLFNTLSQMELAKVGVRRPTTSQAHACVWHPDGASELLDWLGIPPDRRFVRESALDADDEAALRGLVLLDLPDFDSIEADHRREVDRLLLLVDLVVWVTDPQKYADRVIHRQYLFTFHRHRHNTVVVLNQADRLSEADTARCVADLSALLSADGLGSVPVFAASATADWPGVTTLRRILRQAVAGRVATLRRFAADVDGAVGAVAPLVGSAVTDSAVSPAMVRELDDTVAADLGVPVIAQAAARAYRYRAARSTSWPVSRWLRRKQLDPLRRLRIGENEKPKTDRMAGVDLAIQAFADRAGAGLPAPWPAAVTAAARSHAADLPDALDHTVASTDLASGRKRVWWRLVGALHWLFLLAALGGGLWLLIHAGLAAFDRPGLPLVRLGWVPLAAVPLADIPLAAVALAGGVIAGLLTSLLARPAVSIGARRAYARADQRLRTAVADRMHQDVIAPVRLVLSDYTIARQALGEAARHGNDH